MPRCNEAVDKLFVLGSELQLQCVDVAVPLRFGTRTRDGAADNAVLEYPCESEGNGCCSTLRGMIRDSLCDPERFRAPLGLLDSLVATACARVGWRRVIHRIFAAEDATREWATGPRQDRSAPLPAVVRLPPYGRRCYRAVRSRPAGQFPSGRRDARFRQCASHGNWTNRSNGSCPDESDRRSHVRLLPAVRRRAPGESTGCRCSPYPDASGSLQQTG